MTRPAAIPIAGMGMVSCFGEGLEPCVNAMREGRDGISPLTALDLRFAANIKTNQVDRQRFGEGRDSILAIIKSCVRQALVQAGLNPDEAVTDCAMIFGATSFLFVGEAEYRKHLDIYSDPGKRKAGSSADVTGPIAREFGVTGPVLAIHTACSSSANALIVARDMIARGEVRRAIVIGAEGFSAISLGGFYSMMLLDPDGCHPFDTRRRGLQLGEAYGAVLLDADSINSKLVLRGGANLCDIHHVTSASPDGSSMARVMTNAMHDADISASDIVGIKAHGTGSNDNDTAESAAMHSVFHHQIPDFTVIKRYIGHTLGACGVVELTGFAGCLQAGFLPATAGYDQYDARLDVSPLAQAITARQGHYLLNYFGFGGNYASLVVSYD
ncbi:MAG: hypothetical protein OEZ10_05220 [Gammaproteobacteria bacterium]|nr:hypothetical protein [Gammaproteobacteria bacterium]